MANFGKTPGGMPNMASLMKAAEQAQRMMSQAQEAEDALAKETVEGSSEGGVVKVRATGKGDILEIKIAKEAVDPDDVEMLEALVTNAVKSALEKANTLRTERLQHIMPSDMKLPGLF